MAADAVATPRPAPALATAERPDDADVITRARLQAMLEETLLPSPNSVDLHRTAATDYMLRFDARRPHIAELFQENTKLTPHTTLRVPDDDREIDYARAWYFSTAYRLRPGSVTPGQEHVVTPAVRSLPGPLARLLGAFAQRGPASTLLYANDLFLVHRRHVLRVLPESDVLWAERHLSPDEDHTFRTSILRQPAETIAAARAFFVVVAAPWRYMMFLGPRGYRHVLFEAGSLTGQLQFAATQVGLTASRCLDFYDARVDGVLLLDGVERTTLAILALDGEAL